MTGQATSVVTVDLQLASLELDIKTVQNNREEDRKEFHEFRAMVNKIFVTMQNNFDKIQENFRKLLLDPGSEEGQIERSEQGNAQMKINEVHSPVVPAGRPKQLNNYTPPSVHGQEKEAPVVVGSAVLRDHTRNELNLDGTNEVPYRHHNFTNNKHEGNQATGQQQQLHLSLVDMGTVEEWPDGQKQRQYFPSDSRRNANLPCSSVPEVP
ncbi:hypothetical protein D1007_07290 [Hordeum vulgare]|nr:hypothetical protein D1007_07290 [Hordeum vulgare]